MNKTLVISRVLPPQVGGNGRWMWELYSRLPRDQYVIAANHSPGSDLFDRTHDLAVIRLPLELASWGAFGVRRGADYYSIYTRLGRIVREHSIDAVHASNCLPEGFLAWLLKRRFGLPYLVYAHGEELNIASKSRELAWMARRVLRGAALVIANSRNTARFLSATWPISTDRLRVVNPGVDTQEYRPAPRDRHVRARLGWGDRPVILTVGRLQKRKGQQDIVRVLPTVRRRIPNVLYAIVGEGEERRRLEQFTAELALHDCVKLHAELQSDDLVAAYQQCDVFALPNREVNGDFEGFGIVLLEAQACGKPVIAGDSGGTAEAIDVPRSGRIVRQNRPGELAATLTELLQDEALREQMGRAGREWVVNNFDWRILAPRTAALFTQPLGSGVRPPVLEVAATASH